MAKYPNKVYVRLMQQKHGLTVERRTKPDVSCLLIKDKDGGIIFSGFHKGPPEVAWDMLWIQARLPVEAHTGENMFDVWNEMYELKKSWKKNK